MNDAITLNETPFNAFFLLKDNGTAYRKLSTATPLLPDSEAYLCERIYDRQIVKIPGIANVYLIPIRSGDIMYEVGLATGRYQTLMQGNVA